MGGLTNALHIGQSSLAAVQKSIEVVGNNIANVNTPGYSRQKAVLTPYPTINLGGFFIGQGAKVADITREHDVFISGQIFDKNQSVGQESAKSTPLAELERVFSVGEESLATEVDRFFSAWQELSTNPSGRVERDIVIQRGNLLAGAFHTISAELDTVQRNVDNKLAAQIDGINLKLQSVADYNDRIAVLKRSGLSPNSFLDQRDVLLNELSATLGIETFEEADGMVSVQLPGGMPLVRGNIALALQPDTSGDRLQLQLQMGEVPVDLNMSLLGGEFKGLQDIRDRLIPDLREKLDTLAYGLANTVNAQHAAGVGLDGISREFFSSFDPDPLVGRPDAARNFQVALTSAAQVAAGTGSAPGDNTNAQRIASLGDTKAIGGADTFIGYYGKMAAQVGIEASQNRLSLGGAEDALVQLQNMRDGIVGVSLEEEMVSLIQYQKGFQASAKFLATVDEMMDSLIGAKR